MSELLVGMAVGSALVLTHWLAYRWGRHVETPCFWTDEGSYISETSEEDPR